MEDFLRNGNPENVHIDEFNKIMSNWSNLNLNLNLICPWFIWVTLLVSDWRALGYDFTELIHTPR